jgi:DNA adenine methylase
MLKSPLRYPGGKSWLIQDFHKWLDTLGVDTSECTLIEPFCGAAHIGLSCVDRFNSVQLRDYDRQIVNLFWTILSSKPGVLYAMIKFFECTPEAVEGLLRTDVGATGLAAAFQTLVRNRTSYGGILHASARRLTDPSVRWYPDTLIARMKAIRDKHLKIGVRHSKFSTQAAIYGDKRDFIWYIDPPYTAGAKLYTHGTIDVPAMWEDVAKIQGPFLMSFDQMPPEKYGWHVKPTQMRSTKHVTKTEMLISNKPL